MNQTQLSRQSSFSVIPTVSVINIVALYDGMVAAAYVHEAIGSIAIAGHPETKVESQMWSFDMLTRLDVRHASKRAAIEADVFVIAAAASSPLPSHVSSWINTMLKEHRKGAPVMVAVYEESPQQAHALPTLRSELQAVAARWRTPLLCNREMHTRLERELPRLAATAVGGRGFDLGTLLRTPSYGRWGINE